MDDVLEIARIGQCPSTADEVEDVLVSNSIKPVVLGCSNWSDDYPCKPEVEFRVAHTGDSILISWRCREDYVRAVEDDNGHVWEDSCVEFFISFDENTYYNIECNARGAMLCGFGNGKSDRLPASGPLLSEVRRKSSFGQDKFESKKVGESWTVSMIIPLALFFAGAPDDLSGVCSTGNFYKCGDMLPEPHFLSWRPVKTAVPDFHRIEFFGKLKFE